jgi:hypothetical protein
MARTRAMQRSWPDLTLSDEWREYGLLHGVVPDTEFESFRDHHLAKGSTFADWTAAWRTWCRNAEKYKREKQPTIGFTAPPRLSMEQRQAMRDNEEIEAEYAAMTPEQRLTRAREARRRFDEMIARLK